MRKLLPFVLLILSCVVCGCKNENVSENLLPAWQVTESNRYVARYLTDPFVSFSPDSKNVVFTAVSKGINKAEIYKWEIGSKKSEKLFYGFSPNYMDNDTLIYLHPYTGPKCIRTYSLKTGEKKEVCEGLKKSDYWKDIYGIMYNADDRTINVRMCDFTQYYFPGSEVYDMNGSFVSALKRKIDADVLAYSENNGVIAAIYPSDDGERRSLYVAFNKKEDRQLISSGKLGDVQWRPNEKDTLALADGTDVLLINVKDKTKEAIGRFPSANNKSFICRLKWSPDGNYLAVGVFVRKDKDNYMNIYIIDASKLM